MKQTKGKRLVSLLRRRWMTTLEQIQAVGSVCPWKRRSEAMAPDEQLIRKKNAEGLFVYRVIKATSWTA